MTAANRAVAHQFESLSNFRDVGGLKTPDGRTFKSGILFRSAELSRITVQDVAKLRELDIQLICDLRSAHESKKKGPRLPLGSIKVVNIPIQDSETQDGNRKKLLGFLFGKSGGDRFREFSRQY